MTSSSGKRIKTLGSERKDKEPDRSYSNKFLSRKHECHFNELGKLATYPAPANIVVVKEFYTNARRLGDHPTEDYLNYVRGHVIRYDPDSINRFLDTEWAGEQCQFGLNMEEGVDFGDVENVLCVPGGHFPRNMNGAVVNIRRADLTPLAKGISINIGQVIANEIQVCANTMNNKAPLGHPSLITHLCELVGVNISAPPFEKPRKAIDETYYRQYCGGDEAVHPVPPRRPRRGRGPPQGQASTEPQEAEPFQMRDMYMSLIDARMQSIHRGWTLDEFDNVVAWPEEQAQGSRAGAVGASAMDDEDAFEDVEDDEEEEDSDDNMG
ncbi:hypothetical protein LR48_Vigan05g106400 [Vigna angularis]|uniref:Putative plant transposon protein domain-containing protein n=1 Tax=Phaseolus angularis TaxID=3914 RepID=A0A0L9UKR7_PHAAN|nr:hypothetical protein LR48_Vigan05g106400 [Vigna angularis]